MAKQVKLGALQYLLLLIVITVGVTLGNLISSAIQTYLLVRAAEVATAEMQRAANAMGERATQSLRDSAERAQAESEERQQQQQDARAASATGRELFRLCQEWTESHSTNNVQATRDGMQRHCARYSSYVETGVARPR